MQGLMGAEPLSGPCSWLPQIKSWAPLIQSAIDYIDALVDVSVSFFVIEVLLIVKHQALYSYVEMFQSDAVISRLTSQNLSEYDTPCLVIHFDAGIGPLCLLFETSDEEIILS